MESREDFYFDDSDNPGSDDIYWNRQNLRLPNG